MSTQLHDTELPGRYQTDSYVTVKLPGLASRQARIDLERGYIHMGIVEYDAQGKVIREEKGRGRVRDSQHGQMYVSFALFGETDLLVFPAGTSVSGAGFTPEDAIKSLRREVRRVNAGELRAYWKSENADIRESQ